MNRTICLAISYWLTSDIARRMWIDLARELESQGMQLVLLSCEKATVPVPFPVFPIPFLLRDFAREFPQACPRDGSFSKEDWALLETDAARAQGGYAASEALPGMLTCRNFLAEIFEILQPGYVLAWDSASPIAMIAKRLCHETGRPFLGIERGLLPDTLMVETRSMHGYSDLRTHWFAQETPENACDDEKFERLREYYLQNKPQKYDQPAFASGVELRKKLGIIASKVVVFFGNYNPCGMAPVESNVRRYNSPVFKTTEEALTCLAQEFKDIEDLVIVFKPHPLDLNPYLAAVSDGVKIVKDVNVHALIDLADVVVSQLTTLQYEAVLYDKPVVLAARAAWWGRGATYEVNCREEFYPSVISAINREGWETRRANARAFLNWICDVFLIGCNSAVPARRKLADFAKFLSTTALIDEMVNSFENKAASAAKKIGEWRGPIIEPAQTPSASQLRAEELFNMGCIPSVPITTDSVSIDIREVRERAEAMFKIGLWKDASELYKQITTHLPDDLAAWRGRLECSGQLGHKSVVRLLKSQALRLHPEWAEVLDKTVSDSVAILAK